MDINLHPTLLNMISEFTKNVEEKADAMTVYSGARRFRTESDELIKLLNNYLWSRTKNDKKEGN